MPSRQRWQRPHPACTSTVTRSPIRNSSTPGPGSTTVPMYSWPGVKPLLKGSSPSIIAGRPCRMISMSVAQTAIASTRTRTSAAPGLGTGFSTIVSCSGSPRTQAFIVSGIRYSLMPCDPLAEAMSRPLLPQRRQLSRAGEIPSMLGAADQRSEGLAKHAGLVRAGLAGEIEGEIGLRRGEPVAFGQRAGHARAVRRQPILHALFGRYLQSGDASAQCCEIRINGGLELPAQPAQRRDRRADDRGHRGLGAGQLAGSEKATPACPQPKAEQHQIDVARRTVLDRDQRVGNTGPSIEGEREPPEGLAGRVVVAPIPHDLLPDENSRDSCYTEPMALLLVLPLSACANHAPWRWISTSKP